MKFIHNITEVSLMMANISQLRAVLSFGDRNQFYIYLLTLIILTIVAQSSSFLYNVCKYCISLVRAKEIYQSNVQDICCCTSCTKKDASTKYNDVDPGQCPSWQTELCRRYVCNFLGFIIIFANIGITGIGISGDC